MEDQKQRGTHANKPGQGQRSKRNNNGTRIQIHYKQTGEVPIPGCAGWGSKQSRNARLLNNTGFLLVKAQILRVALGIRLLAFGLAGTAQQLHLRVLSIILLVPFQGALVPATRRAPSLCFKPRPHMSNMSTMPTTLAPYIHPFDWPSTNIQQHT